MIRLLSITLSLLFLTGCTGLTYFDTDKKDPFTATEALDPVPEVETVESDPEPKTKPEEPEPWNASEAIKAKLNELEKQLKESEEANSFTPVNHGFTEGCWMMDSATGCHLFVDKVKLEPAPSIFDSGALPGHYYYGDGVREVYSTGPEGTHYSGGMTGPNGESSDTGHWFGSYGESVWISHSTYKNPPQPVEEEVIGRKAGDSKFNPEAHVVLVGREGPNGEPADSGYWCGSFGAAAWVPYPSGVETCCFWKKKEKKINKPEWWKENKPVILLPPKDALDSKPYVLEEVCTGGVDCGSPRCTTSSAYMPHPCQDYHGNVKFLSSDCDYCFGYWTEPHVEEKRDRGGFSV